MDTLTWICCESRWTLAIGGFVANFLLLAWWRRGNSPRPLQIGLLVWLALLILETFVVTQREAAADTLWRIEQDFLVGRSTALQTALASNFSVEQYDRRTFAELARQQLAKLRIHWLQRMHLQIESSTREQFVAKAAYLANVSVDNFGGGLRSTWRITFVQTPLGWRIRSVAPPEIEGQRFGRWDEFAR